MQYPVVTAGYFIFLPCMQISRLTAKNAEKPDEILSYKSPELSAFYDAIISH